MTRRAVMIRGFCGRTKQRTVLLLRESILPMMLGSSGKGS